jgi:hypothetical protein
MKLVRAGLMVFAAFYACWLPFFTVLCLQMYGGMVDNAVVKSVYVFSSLLATLNSAINPIIYTHSVPAFKRELKRLLRIGAGSSTDVTVTSVQEYSTTG